MSDERSTMTPLEAINFELWLCQERGMLKLSATLVKEVAEEITRLTAALAAAEAQVRLSLDAMQERTLQRDEAIAQIAVLVGALKFYSENWPASYGQRARDTLANLPARASALVDVAEAVGASMCVETPKAVREAYERYASSKAST